MQPEPTSKLPDVGTTIFTVMSALAREYDALNLSQGFPDFEPPAALRDFVNERIQSGFNQYPPMPGIEPLRRRIARHAGEANSSHFDHDEEITVVSGASEGLFSAILALVHSGERVVILDPAYDLYEPAVRLAGGVAVRIPLLTPDFRPDMRAIADALAAGASMLILNTPHNPVGTVLSADCIDDIERAVADTDAIVLSDEVYEHIVFDGERHTSVLSHPGLRERAVAVYSFGKTFHATGWKVGYVVAAPALTREIRRVHQFNTFTTATPLQWALSDYLDAEPDFPASIAAFYQDKRDRFRRALSESRLKLLPCRGTYFQLADFSAVSDMGDVEFARWLTSDVGVAAIPVSVFSATPTADSLVRFCFAKSNDVLDEAARRLCAI